MNVKALLALDQWLGVPLCFVCTMARAIFNRPPPGSAPPARSILFVKLAEQGSTVLAYQALRRAGELVGRKNVYFIAFKENRFILDLLEVIPEENVITISSNGVPAMMGSLLGGIRRLRALNLEAAVDMEFFSRGSAVLTYLSGARRRA